MVGGEHDKQPVAARHLPWLHSLGERWQLGIAASIEASVTWRDDDYIHREATAPTTPLVSVSAGTATTSASPASRLESLLPDQTSAKPVAAAILTVK